MCLCIGVKSGKMKVDDPILKKLKKKLGDLVEIKKYMIRKYMNYQKKQH